jgi:hypothetical protein
MTNTTICTPGMAPQDYEGMPHSRCALLAMTWCIPNSIHIEYTWQHSLTHRILFIHGLAFKPIPKEGKRLIRYDPAHVCMSKAMLSKQDPGKSFVPHEVWT